MTEQELADEVFNVGSQMEQLTADIRSDAKQAEFYSSRVAAKIGQMTGLRRLLSQLNQKQYSNSGESSGK